MQTKKQQKKLIHADQQGKVILQEDQQGITTVYADL